jgi:predicted metal-binding protein
MKKAVVIGCGAYMDSGYGCPGEWRCLKAAALGDHLFDGESQVVAFVKCVCPGRSLVNNTAMALKLAELKPDVIHFSTCLANAKPDCPYFTPEEMANMIKGKIGVEVVLGTHDYH